MNSSSSVVLRIDRHDGSHGFEDPAVPVEWTIDELVARAVPRLRYPVADVASGRPLKYSLLSGGMELPRDQTVGDAFPSRTGRVHVVTEYENA